MNRLALTAAIAVALSTTSVWAWDDKECEDWLKKHPGNPHPDCVQQATPTPRPRYEKTPTPKPESTATPKPPTSTPVPNTPVATPTQPVARSTPVATPIVNTECIPCGEAEAATPTPRAISAAAIAPTVEVKPGIETSSVFTEVATPVVLPSVLPTTGGDPLQVYSLLGLLGSVALGLGIALRRLS